MTERWYLFVDGASRGNPGPSGVGYVLLRGNTVMKEGGYFVGTGTNNRAEYCALIVGLASFKEVLKKMGMSGTLTVYADSELLVRQVTGIYRVRNSTLQVLWKTVHQLLDGVNAHIEHIVREKNSHADALANEGIDMKRELPASIQTL